MNRQDKTIEPMSNPVYSGLRDMILHLDLPPGTVINETETAEKFSVSRTPVRDAFKALQSERLLEIKPYVGTFVTRIDISRVSDVLYMRAVVEQAVVRELTAAIDPIQEVKLRVILQNQKALVECDMDAETLGREFIRSDNRFHRALFAAAGRDGLYDLLNSFVSHYERFRTLVNFAGRENIAMLYEQHTSILDGILMQNFERLDALLHHHIYDGFARSAEIIHLYPDYFDNIN